MRKIKSTWIAPSLISAALLGVVPRAGTAHEGHKRHDAQVPPEAREKAQVCTDGKSHYIAVTPDDAEKGRYATVYYGDGKRFIEVPPYKNQMRTLFRDPRFYNSRVSAPEHGWGSREIDKRLLSGVSLEEGKCSMWCGERDKKLTLLDPQKAQGLLKGAAFVPISRQWEPHALARDDEGNYYFVDHGYFADTQKNHRLFIGHKGALLPQQVTEAITDSGGDVIITKAGTLSLSGGKAQWKVGSKTTPLIPLTLDEDREEGAKNVLLIYNELGVYKGERLGTPCDDL